MNKRIQELAEQAGLTDYMVFGRIESKEDVLKNFAESIVRECLDIVNRKEYSYHEADPLWETAELIKERFGVK